MRIIAGERRGHRFDGPKGTGTRPTSDLVRESIFNILGESVIDRVVVDLFAGTGAIGLEALSRGASRAIFVELNRHNVGLIYRNLTTLRYEDRVTVLATDAYRWGRSYTPENDEPIIVLIDPPYREYEVRWKKVNQFLGLLMHKLPAGSIIAVESGKVLNERVLPDFQAWDVRRYGGTQVAVRVVSADDRADAGDDPTDSDAEGPIDDDASDEPLA